MIRIIVIDDHPIVRSGCADLLRAVPDFDVVGEGGSLAEAREIIGSSVADILILDLQLPDGDGEDLVKELAARPQGPRTIVLTTFGGADTIRRAMEVGAAGFLTKDTLRRDLITAVRKVAVGGRAVNSQVAERLADSMSHDALTAREMEVLRELAHGQSNKLIARALGITEATVKIHVRHILEKMAATDRTDAVMKALSRGTIRLR